MADPRFYSNHGPFALADICSRIGAFVDRTMEAQTIYDVASLSGAGPRHLTYFDLKTSDEADSLVRSRAGFCIVSQDRPPQNAPKNMALLPVSSPQYAFAAAIALFYPDAVLSMSKQNAPSDACAWQNKDVAIGPNVVVGENAEIGEGTTIGANTVIGEGVAIGRRCRIGSNVTISHAYIGDDVLILPSASIGQPGFGFASSVAGHIKMPQIGRVIIQDRVEIGACTTIDRGALGDTVIGEGTKIDNLVQIGHNTHIGRHCMIVSQVGISGSCEIGDFVVMGGQVGLADHVRVESGTRFAARAGVMPGYYAKGDWSGTPAVPASEWRRQAVAVSRLGRKPKRDAE